MRTTRIAPDASGRLRVEMEVTRSVWSVPPHVEPFASVACSRKQERVALPWSDTLVRRLLLRLERAGVASREA